MQTGENWKKKLHHNKIHEGNSCLYFLDYIRTLGTVQELSTHPVMESIEN
jgi:hypothetical protein